MLFFHSHVTYLCLVWGQAKYLNWITLLQKRAIRMLHSAVYRNLYFKLGFTPYKAKQPLWGMELQEKETKKIKVRTLTFQKIDEKLFLFRTKSSFRSQDIYIFVMIFWWCRKNSLIRRIRLISKLMTSQP